MKKLLMIVAVCLISTLGFSQAVILRTNKAEIYKAGMIELSAVKGHIVLSDEMVGIVIDDEVVLESKVLDIHKNKAGDELHLALESSNGTWTIELIYSPKDRVVIWRRTTDDSQIKFYIVEDSKEL